MRIAPSIVAGLIAVLAALASPALATNPSSVNSHANANAKQTDEDTSSPGDDRNFSSNSAAATYLEAAVRPAENTAGFCR